MDKVCERCTVTAGSNGCGERQLPPGSVGLLQRTQSEFSGVLSSWAVVGCVPPGTATPPRGV